MRPIRPRDDAVVLQSAHLYSSVKRAPWRWRSRLRGDGAGSLRNAPAGLEHVRPVRDAVVAVHRQYVAAEDGVRVNVRTASDSALGRGKLLAIEADSVRVLTEGGRASAVPRDVAGP